MTHISSIVSDTQVSDPIDPPDRIVHLYVTRIYEPGPERLEPPYRDLAGIYAVTVPGDLRGKRAVNCAIDGFHVRFDPRKLCRFRICAVDLKTGQVLERDRRTDWDALAGRCKDVTMVKRFRGCAPGFVMEDPADMTGGEGVREHPGRFDPTVRTVHLRVGTPGLTQPEYIEHENSSVLGVWAITVPADLPENAIANCTLGAFNTHVFHWWLDGIDFTVTDPATGKVLQLDKRRKYYGLAHRCLGLHMLEPFTYPSADCGRLAMA